MKKIYVTRPLMPDINKYKTYLDSIFESNHLTNNGKFLLSLENKLISALKLKQGAAFCNGTTALMVALKSLDLKEGSVITTPFTFPATVNALVWNNLEPIFCDIDYETMNILPESVEKLINFRVSAVLPVHVFGTPCDVHGFWALGKEYNLKLIYDAAHAFNTSVHGIGIGNFGDVTMFSFHSTKLFHTIEGGMLSYNSDELNDTIKQLRNFGIKNDQTGSILPGLNGKMNEFQAAMGLCILDKIEKEIKKRKKIHELYTHYLSDIPWIKLLNINTGTRHSYQYFPIRIKKNRNKIYEYMEENNVFPRKYFYPLCSDFKHFKYLRASVPNAVRVSEEILCLPFYGDLTEGDIERICELIITGEKK